jgi:hypothetical protein
MAFATVPAAGQVAARLDVRIPVGHQSRVGFGSRGRVMIGAYAPALVGSWQDDFQYWEPVTVYYYDGMYYDYPVVDYATPVFVYRYNDRLFFPPRDAGFVRLHLRADRFYAPRPREVSRGEYGGGRSYRDAAPMEYGQRPMLSRDRVRAITPRADGNGRGARAPSSRGNRSDGHAGGQSNGHHGH